MAQYELKKEVLAEPGKPNSATKLYTMCTISVIQISADKVVFKLRRKFKATPNETKDIIYYWSTKQFKPGRTLEGIELCMLKPWLDKYKGFIGVFYKDVYMKDIQ
jgi:hypothetical protein